MYNIYTPTCKCTVHVSYIDDYSHQFYYKFHPISLQLIKVKTGKILHCNSVKSNTYVHSSEKLSL